jgi:hypothetical protein
VSDHDVVNSHPTLRRQIDGKLLCARPIEENPIAIRHDPPAGAPRLFRRFLDGTLEPSQPVESYVTAVREYASLVREDKNIVAANNQEVAKLFAIALAVGPLVPEKAGVAPERQERPIT